MILKVAIFDYGAENIFSLRNSLEKNGAQVDVITGLNKSKEYSGLLLPGVGNFDPAIRSIRDYSSTDFKDYVGESMPVLGICLGMEMFFEKSEEGKEQGLSVIDGEVVLLPNTMKVPHMGWNSLEIERQNNFLEGVNDGSWVYFVHSYMIKTKETGLIVASTDYGIKVPAVIQQKNFIGTQFHPEKSGKIGSLMLSNFLSECKK